jgi:hypothetical protein
MNSHTPPNHDLMELPTELHALYAALAEDGAQWRNEAAVPRPRLDAYVRELAAQPPLTTLEIELEDESGALATTRDSRRPVPPHHSRRDRRRGLLAVAAMVAVVVLLAAVIHTMLPPRLGSRGPTPSPSHTPSPTGTASVAVPVAPSGQWQSLNALTYSTKMLPGGGPAIAPSNPLVVYEPMLPASGQPASLRRTEDGGKSWVELPVPVSTGSNLDWFGAVVNPFDARTVYLVAEQRNPTSCPPSSAYPRGATSGIGPCVFNYVSTDAGSHWQRLAIGVTTAIGLGADTAKPGLLVQGTRLYATGADFGCSGEKNLICERILTSTDGMSWVAIDHYLAVNQSQFICDWAATPQGSTVFAITGANGPLGCTYYPNQLTLWRSDDVGVNWTRVGALPTPNIRGFVAAGGGDAPITLYANLPATVGTSIDSYGYRNPVLSDAPSDLRASTDGGKTWQRAPSAGIGGGLKPDAQPVGVISDGALLMPFTAAGSNGGSNPTYYAWMAGAGRWQLAARPNGAAVPQSVLVIPVSGRDTFWVVTVSAGGASMGEYRVYEYTT